MGLLIAVALRALWLLFRMALLERTSSQAILSQVVFILILTELYRTLIFYLREHRVAVGLVVEAAIVSILRDLMLTMPHSHWSMNLSISGLLLVLGMMLALDRWLTRTRNEVSETSAH
jgi:uncharacterized membrane protein (DUF373 family)